jgi:hypothetical protein
MVILFMSAYRNKIGKYGLEETSAIVLALLYILIWI